VHLLKYLCGINYWIEPHEGCENKTDTIEIRVFPTPDKCGYQAILYREAYRKDEIAVQMLGEAGVELVQM
jgi:hypothetical protein